MCAAPIGNQFWKLRSKHGRDKIFTSPDLLWEAACEYFEWCDENPFLEDTIQKVKVNGEGEFIKHENLTKMRAYTWDGLELFLDIDSLRHYKNNEVYKDFFQVITRIEKIIYNQKFTGAAAGFLNPNIIARDLGLVDKKESKVMVEQPLFGDEDERDNTEEGA
ncbi:DNA-packaging protein [Sphingobacterium sp. ML3W]|uniref:DNA-packaging protein n=1 Tax=Sphingobacterium sp. ML3W TaxID=1538644 RepID=UPI00249ADC00|nr:DNA-packaging protein [Sphingobacterium sp. ML3W]WFA79645.1 DNA-packaging protein [Sphingobacterium sp. ML3W]